MFPEQKPNDEPIKDYPEMPVASLTPKRKSSGLLRIIIIFVVLALIGVIVFVVMQHKSTPVKPATTTKSSSQSSTAATKISSTTKRYDSSDLYLGFYYPSDWTVSDPGNGVLTATSPKLTLKSLGNKTINARIVMTIQNQQTAIAKFAANTAVSPIESQKLTYKNPTPSQRAQTYLTAVNYTGSNTSIDTFYITGDNGYTAGQYVPQGDIVKDNPLISLNFFACSDPACIKYTAPTAIITSSWADANLSKPLVSMLESLVLD